MDSRQYVCIVTDESQGIIEFEYRTTGVTPEDALYKTQEEFPCACIEAIHEAEDFDDAERLTQLARKKRAMDRPVDGPLGKIIHLIADSRRF